MSEPLTIAMVGVSLLVVARYNRPALVALRLLVVGAIAGALAAVIAVWRLL